MLSRREVKQQAIVMQRDIRRMAQDSTNSSRELLPSLRELAQRYGISHSLAAQSLKALIDEGVVYSVPRVGTFAGRPPVLQNGVFLLLLHRPDTNSNCATVQIGFEERVAQLGGVCLTLTRENAQLWSESGRIHNIIGVFEFNEAALEPEQWSGRDIDAPRVKFREPWPDEVNVDIVDFDNVRGGQQATQHLLDLGHQRIAFLALHHSDDDTGIFTWSKEREEGWRSALTNGGHATARLAFHPMTLPNFGMCEQRAAAHEASEALLKDEGITAVVAANSVAAEGLFEALREARIPGSKWPAVVCFDSVQFSGRDEAAHVTALRLPWEDVGRSAADLLWERGTGQLAETPTKRLVPMRLITRLTSTENWTEVAKNFESHGQPKNQPTEVVG